MYTRQVHTVGFVLHGGPWLHLQNEAIIDVDSLYASIETLVKWTNRKAMSARIRLGTSSRLVPCSRSRGLGRKLGASTGGCGDKICGMKIVGQAQ
jgi:hypothetical protein